MGSVAEELAAAQGSSQTVLEGELLNLGVTSPAAALALGLMYLQTNDAAVAAAFQLPGACGGRWFYGAEWRDCSGQGLVAVRVVVRTCNHGAAVASADRFAQRARYEVHGVHSPAARGLPPTVFLPSLCCVSCPLPDTHFALDFVQPEQLTLRTLMRSLGGWKGLKGSLAGKECVAIAIQGDLPASLPASLPAVCCVAPSMPP